MTLHRKILWLFPKVPFLFDPWHTRESGSKATLMESFLKPREISRGVTPGQMTALPPSGKNVPATALQPIYVKADRY
jgi:hypothetical protein